jgi:hypothetical protein
VPKLINIIASCSNVGPCPCHEATICTLELGYRNTQRSCAHVGNWQDMWDFRFSRRSG